MAALLGEELGIVVYVHAHVFLEVAAALAHEAPGAAAGAGADGDRPSSLDDVLYLVIGSSVGVILDRAAHGHGAHGAHTDREVRNKYGCPVTRIALEALGDDGVLFNLLLHGEHAFHDAGDPDGIIIGLDIVIVSLVHAADDAALDECVDHGLRVLNAGAGLFGYDLNASALTDLDVHANIRHFVGHDRVEYHVLWIRGRNARIGTGLKAYLGGKQKNLFSEGHKSPSFHIKNFVFQHKCFF